MNKVPWYGSKAGSKAKQKRPDIKKPIKAEMRGEKAIPLKIAKGCIAGITDGMILLK